MPPDISEKVPMLRGACFMFYLIGGQYSTVQHSISTVLYLSCADEFLL